MRRKANDHLREFAAQNSTNPGCWEWRGDLDKDGYGRTKFNRVTTRAHRAMYRLFVGEIPAGLNLCHECDNRRCCRPDHMFIGTQKQNCEDAKAKDRHSRGERQGNAKLNDEAVRVIRASTKTQWELAREFGVWQGVISAVKLRQRWAHVQD